MVITKNGKGVAKLTNTRDSKMRAIHSMRGVLKGKVVTLETIRVERLEKYNKSAD